MAKKKPLLNQLLPHQIYMQRLATQKTAINAATVKKMKRAVRDAVLLFGDNGRTTKRLNKLMRDLDKELTVYTDEWQKRVLSELKAIADYEKDWIADTIDKNTNKDVKVVTSSADDVWAACEFQPVELGQKPVGLNDMLDAWSRSERTRLVRGVQSGFVQGKTTAAIVKEVVGIGGLADVSLRDANTVVRTAVMHVASEARAEFYRANSDIIKKYEIVATLDSRTSTVCRGLDNQTFEVGKGPMPPFHPNCRTTTAPVIDDDFLAFLDEGATRASAGGQVSADMSYYDWLKGQPARVQDEALGPVRAAIFRDAGLSPEEFRKASIDGFNRPMTLEEMAAADKRIAEYLHGSK